jgi:hypothetical protein
LEKLRNNIQFVKNLLKSYPVPEKHPQCPIKSKRRRPVKFDAHSNMSRLSSPRLDSLCVSYETQKALLEAFLADTEKMDIIRKFKEEIPTETVRGINYHNRLTSKEAQRKRFVQVVHRDYKSLKRRTEKLLMLIQDRKNFIEMVQVRVD